MVSGQPNLMAIPCFFVSFIWPEGGRRGKIATLWRVARQPLGQHFLTGAGWSRKILETLPLYPNETWVEIGPGHGEMTQGLAGDGRRVVAIEADARLAKGLEERARSKGSQWRGVEVLCVDVLRVDFARLSGERFRVYGNLPYYITSPILRRLFQWADQIESIHVVIQLEVAARIAAKPGGREYGFLSALCQFYAKPEIVLRIPRGAFRPPPRVTSALVRLTLPGERDRLGVADQRAFLEFVQVCFSQKRKTLRNNLRALASPERVQAAVESLELPPKVRAEQLSLPQFAALFVSLG